jgi:PAS domain S-box-containing protein
MTADKPLNILSLEGSIADFDLICNQLTRAGCVFTITRVDTESDFVSELRNAKYEIILSGFKLPGFDAFKALERSSEICPGVPFICVSGFIGEEATIELIKAGAVDYVIKDRLRRLPFALKRALDDARAKETQLKAEQALKESEQNFRTLADSGQTLIWTSGTDTHYNYFNSVWLDFRGQIFEQESVNGYMTGVHPDDLHQRMDIYLDAFHRREKFSIEYRLMHNDGEYRWIQDNGSPRYSSTGDFLGYIGQCQDINKLKQSELVLQAKNEELQKVNAEKDKFFTILAHDLRSPFNSLLGFTQILVEDLSELKPEDIRKMAQAMRTSAKGLYSLLENLLVWSGSQRGTNRFVPVEFLLTDIILENLKLIQESAHIKGIEIKINIPDDLMVFADENMIGSTIRNLVSNAVKFTPKKGEISILAKPVSGNMVEISIKDSGMGMSDEMRDKLFKLNESIGRRGTEGEPSSGLGLILCKDFIKKNGGEIWVESEEGIGSVFYFTLPCHFDVNPKTDPSFQLADSKKNIIPGKLKILIADDDEASEMLITIALKPLSNEILTARTGVEAVELCREHPDIDLILMDFKMPLMDGYEATQFIRQFNTEVVIIAQTAFEKAGDYQMALEAGCNEYILKPFNRESIKKLIRKHFRIE